MIETIPFTYNDLPATLDFSDVVGELSEIHYFDKGVDTLLKIKKFEFDESTLRITVSGERWVFYNDGTLIKSPEAFSIDATSQENINYFANLSTPKMSATVKRMKVNGVALEYLGFPLFDTATGEFIGINVPEA